MALYFCQTNMEYNINNDAAVLSGGDTMMGKAMMIDNLVEK